MGDVVDHVPTSARAATQRAPRRAACRRSPAGKLPPWRATRSHAKDRKRSLRAGFQPRLTWPFDVFVLVFMVAALIERPAQLPRGVGSQRPPAASACSRKSSSSAMSQGLAKWRSKTPASDFIGSMSWRMPVSEAMNLGGLSCARMRAAATQPSMCGI